MAGWRICPIFRRPTGRRARSCIARGSAPRNTSSFMRRRATTRASPSTTTTNGTPSRFTTIVLFMANTGLRPDEAKNLQHRDVAIVEDEATGERILEIEVRGKRGIGYCKSMPSAVRPYERLLDRPKPGLPQGETAAPPPRRRRASRLSRRSRNFRSRPIRSSPATTSSCSTGFSRDQTQA